LLFNCISRTLDLQNLFERTRLSVYYVIGLISAIYCRLYWFPIACYQFIIHNQLNFYLTLLLSIHCICITVFSLLIIIMCSNRLLKIMFEPKIQSLQIQNATLFAKAYFSTSLHLLKNFILRK